MEAGSIAGYKTVQSRREWNKSTSGQTQSANAPSFLDPLIRKHRLDNLGGFSKQHEKPPGLESVIVIGKLPPNKYSFLSTENKMELMHQETEP